LALVFLGLQDEHEAISWLDVAFAEGSIWSLGFRSDPMLRSLKGHPAFERLLSKIGTPNLYRAPEIRTSASGVLLGSAQVGESS